MDNHITVKFSSVHYRASSVSCKCSSILCIYFWIKINYLQNSYTFKKMIGLLQWMYEFNYRKFPLIYDVFNYKKICNKNTLHSKYNTH